MNIEYFERVKYSKNLKRYTIEAPAFIYDKNVTLNQYTVQKGEEMRLDLVIKSIYDDDYYYMAADVLLYINGIDNPLNIKEGQVILYPSFDDSDAFRYSNLAAKSDTGRGVQQTMAVPNKTTRVDSNRSKFLSENYSLPPVLLKKSDPPVKLSDTKFIVGGIK